MNNGNTVQSNSNNFFGIKVSQPGINVNNATNSQLILQDDYSTRTYYNTSGQPLLQLGVAPGTNNKAYGLQLLDSNGDVIARYGEQPDGTFNLKFFDTSGIGIAQFGQFIDGSVALKIAVPGVEVSTASGPQQFTFNSDYATVISPLSGVITIPGLSSQPGGSNGVQAATPIAHGLDYVPSIIAFCEGPVFIGPGPTIQYMNSPVPVTFTDTNLAGFQLSIGTDATYIYAYNSWLTAEADDAIPAFPITYYLLNVTA